MKTVKLEFKLYQFSELKEDAQRVAIWTLKNELNDERTFEDVNDGIFYDDTATREIIEINEYYFYERGNLAHCVTYTGNQEKSGQTFYIYEGREIELI